MIRKENIIINGRELVRTHSDSGFMVERDGVLYDEAIDPVGIERNYTETDEPTETTDEYAEAGKILLGVSE